MIQRRKPLLRKTPLKRASFLRSAAPTSSPKPRTSGLRRVSKRRSAELRLYAEARKRYLAEHPICEVWLRERGYQRVGSNPLGEIMYQDAAVRNWTHLQLLLAGAPHSSEVHHQNKRRGKMLLDETFWLAVSRTNHARIEENKNWARENGFLLNF